MLLRYYDNAAPSPKLLQALAQMVQEGEMIIIPTDTVYSICCDALNQQALERLAKLKGVDVKKSHFSIMCSDISMASNYVKLDNNAFKLIKAHTPGPFTFILPTSSSLPKIYKGRKEVGIRIPNHALPQALSEYLSIPLTGFSLPKDHQLDNAFDFDPELIHTRWEKHVGAVVDGGVGGIKESAIIDCTQYPFRVLREGPEAIEL